MKSIRLRDNNITAQGCVYLQEALKDSYTIEELVRKKNDFRNKNFDFLRIFQKIGLEQKD